MAGVRQLWLSGQCGRLSRSLLWSDSLPDSAHGHLPGCPQARFMNDGSPLFPAKLTSFCLHSGPLPPFHRTCLCKFFTSALPEWIVGGTRAGSRQTWVPISLSSLTESSSVKCECSWSPPSRVGDRANGSQHRPESNT